MFVNYKEVGKRIAKRRKELGLKQRYVNEIADLSDKYLSNIETARSIPSIDVLMRICKALETTPDYFLLGAVAENDNVDFTDYLYQSIKKLTNEQQKFVISFLEWYKDQ